MNDPQTAKGKELAEWEAIMKKIDDVLSSQVVEDSFSARPMFLFKGVQQAFRDMWEAYHAREN